MALRFVESFDHYSVVTAGIGTSKWDGEGGTGQGVQSAYGRFGNGYHAQFNRDAYLYKNFDNQDTWIAGCALKFLVSAPNASTRIPLLFYDQTGGNTQCYVQFESGTGRLQAVGASGLLSTGTTVLRPDVWNYIELKATIHNTTGSMEVAVNGATDINVTNVDTQTTANAYANRIYFANRTNTNTGWDWYLDDVYVCDGTGSTNNDLLGDVRIQAILPSGNGNSSQFVGSDSNSVDNYLLVDDSTPDGDTTYVQSATVGNKDTYAFGDVTPTSGTVYGLQSVLYARKTDAGTRDICAVTRSAGVEDDGPNHGLSVSYTNYLDIFEQDPSAAQWTISSVNAAEFGQKITS